MSATFTMWSNLAEGILAISCKTVNSRGDLIPVKTFTCAGLKISLVYAIIFFVANLYQIIIYYTNHRKKLWKTRQRIIYLSVLYIICSTLCLSIMSVLGLFHLMFFCQQALFLQILAYLIKKIEKLTMGSFIKIANKGIYVLIVLLFACLGICLLKKLDEDNNFDRSCPGMLETHGLSIKVFVLSIMMGLYIFGTVILTRLLARQHKSLFDQSSLKKRDTELLKLKFAMLVIVAAEAVQLLISLYHLKFQKGTDACSPIPIYTMPVLESLITVSYRILTCALPVLVITWLIWVRKDPNRTFSQPNGDDEDGHARFASSLSFHSRSPTKYTMSESFLTQYRITKTYKNQSNL